MAFTTRVRDGHALEGEQLFLERELVARISGQGPGASHHAMAGHDDGERVVAQRLRDRPRGRGPPDLTREMRIRDDGAIRQRRRRAQHFALEVAPRQPEVERPREPRPAPREVFEDLLIERFGVRTVLDDLDAVPAQEA